MLNMIVICDVKWKFPVVKKLKLKIHIYAYYSAKKGL